jgi:folate-dependent tRNA-U54 methylase TrmFO/GidA
MNVTFGIMESLPERIRKKANRYAKVAERALEIIQALQPELDVSKD